MNARKRSVALDDIADGKVEAVARRYSMSVAGAEKLLEDLRPVLAKWAFDPIDVRAEGLRSRSRDTRQRVIAALPDAEKLARADAKRHGRRVRASAVNSYAAHIAGCSVRTVVRIRGATKGTPK